LHQPKSSSSPVTTFPLPSAPAHSSMRPNSSPRATLPPPSSL
jgi:hypothetical protein